MFVGGGAEVGGWDVGVVEFAGVAYVPAFEAFGGDFGMELEGQGIFSEGEGLLVVEFGFCEMKRASGKVEGVAVPVKDRKRQGRAEERTKLAGRRFGAAYSGDQPISAPFLPG